MPWFIPFAAEGREVEVAGIADHSDGTANQVGRPSPRTRVALAAGIIGHWESRRHACRNWARILCESRTTGFGGHWVDAVAAQLGPVTLVFLVGRGQPSEVVGLHRVPSSVRWRSRFAALESTRSPLFWRVARPAGVPAGNGREKPALAGQLAKRRSLDNRRDSPPGLQVGNRLRFRLSWRSVERAPIGKLRPIHSE